MSADSPRVLLMRLSCRTSSRGNEYLTGFLGAARVVAFKAKEPDKYGNEQWEVFVAEPQQRDQSRRQRVEILPPERGHTAVHRIERRDPRQERVDELAARFEPDSEPPF